MKVDAFLTWHKGDYNYFNILPRVTVFVSPRYKHVDGSDEDELVGKSYSLQIGWLVFECSIDFGEKKGGPQ